MVVALWILGSVRGTRVRIVGLIAMSLVLTATYVAQGVFIALVIAAVLDGDSWVRWVGYVGGIAGCAAVRAVILARRDLHAARAAAWVKDGLRQRLLHSLFELGPGWLRSERSGSVQATFSDGVEALDSYIGRYMPQAVSAVLGAAAVTGWVIAIDPLVGSIVLGCSVLLPVLPTASRRLLDRRERDWDGAYRALYSDNLDALQGMATLKAFNASRRFGARLAAQAYSFSRDSLRLVSAVILYLAAVSVVTGVGVAVAVGVGSVQRINGDITTTELLLMLLLVRESFRPLQDLQDAYHAAYVARPACRAIADLLDAQPDVKPLGFNAGSRSVAHTQVAGGGTAPALSFDHVNFTYPNQAHPALHEFSLEIEPGSRVALVGRSGAGKTTVVSLLLRYFEYQTGTICIGGHDIRALDVPKLRSLIGVVAQDTFLFHGTIRENLLLARPDATIAQITAAAEAARADEFIMSLSDGYDTVVGERGLKLSGGERQRIAIARAVLKNAPVLVLDEATSSLDAVNEAEIHSALESLTKDRTTLVIAHRLSTVGDAEHIVVLENGRITEAGSRGELLASKSTFANFVAAQYGSR